MNYLTVRIDDKRCNYCLECISVCPTEALTYDKCFEHEAKLCSNCQGCMDICEQEAIKILMW